MNKVIAFGDSFTWGSDMKDTVRAEEFMNSDRRNTEYYSDTYSRSTWSALLARHFNFEYKCHAHEGCSNQSILREFYRHIPEIDPGDLVILNFTWRDRYDFLNVDKLQEHELYDDYYAWETVRPSGTEESKYFELYYKHIQSSQWDIIESLKAINLVLSYLDVNNIDYIATCIDDLIYKDPYHNTEYARSLQRIYKNNIIWFDGTGFHQWSKNNNYPISPMWHPLEEAHEAAFNYIKQYKGW